MGRVHSYNFIRKVEFEFYDDGLFKMEMESFFSRDDDFMDKSF